MRYLLIFFSLLITTPLLAYNLKDQGLFKESYVMPLSYDLSQPLDRKAQEIKFRFSLYQRLFSLTENQFYFAYTQTSWWQAYDQQQSRPFRETNYNPEFFIQVPYLQSWGIPWVHLGGEHESNGGREPYSRSWNRLYLRYGFTYHEIEFRHKLFWRLPEQAKKYPTDPSGDENPDIIDYYGNNEIELSSHLFGLMAMGRFRYNPVTQRGFAEVNAALPLTINNTSVIIQYLQGYGESLSDYNRLITKWSIGLLFNQL